MSDRFSLGPLVGAAIGGVRVRAAVGRERLDWLGLALLLGIPATLLILSVVGGWTLRDAGSVVGGLALLSAALVAVVVQLASWRERLTARALKREGVACRAIDEAVAHTLLATVTSVLLAACAIVVANGVNRPEGEPVLIPWVARALTGVLVGGGSYLVLTIILIVNLVFDAYQQLNRDDSSKRNEGQAA